MANHVTLQEDDSDFDRTSNYEVDSDDESLINVDSPADGYFVHRDHPQATFVENPSRQSEDKEREAAEERQRSRSVPTAPVMQSAGATRRPAGLDESALLLDAGPAPPDYYQATAGRGAPPQSYARGHTREMSYGSISSPPPSRGQGQVRDSVDGVYANVNHGGTSQNSPPFTSDHPLVRNGLFDEQGVLNSRGQQPQSMRDQERGQPRAPPLATQPQPQATLPPTESNAARRSVGRDEESDVESDVEPPYYQHHHHHHHQHDLKRHHKRWRRFCWCCCVPRMGCFNITLIVALIFMLIMFTSRPHSDSADNPHWRRPVGTSPSPPDDSKISIPDHPSTRQCNFNSAAQTYKSFDFHNPGNFSFLEMIDSSTFSHLSPAGARIGGRVRIAPFPSSKSSDDSVNDKDVPIRVWVHVVVTQPYVVQDLRYAMDEDGFELGFPDISAKSAYPEFGDQGWERPCVDFSVLIQVRGDVELQNWDLTTANLDVEVTDGMFYEYSNAWSEFFDEDDKSKSMLEQAQNGLSITNDTSMYAVRGKIEVAYWSSRRIRISTTSGSIHGTYALRDLLEIQSQSGSIDVGVEPKKAAKNDPSDAPADFIVKSTSGSVSVECPARHDETQGLIPERQYRTRVESYSSTINGRFILGVSTSFKSYSGSIEAYVLPLSANAWNSSLYTATSSSTTSLNLLEALGAVPFASGAGSVNPDPPYNSRWEMGSIRSVHKSTSGSISLKYPSHWSGLIEGRSVSGSLDVRGKDVEIISDEHGPGFSKLRAKKGSGNSQLTFKTMTSSVDIVVGEEV